MDLEALKEENDRLRQENVRLRLALEEARQRQTEPEEVVRAIQQGEVDALVVQEAGTEAIYSLQPFDSVYRALVEECLPYGVWLADPDGELVYITPSFLELLHVDLGEMQRRGQFHFLPPETRDPIEREWARCRTTGDTFNVEYRARFGGTERTIWTHGILARTTDRQFHWVGVNIDVTEREAIKDELRQQAAALKEADRRKDEFLALLGHELRNPLAAIHNGLHLLLQAGSRAINVGRRATRSRSRCPSARCTSWPTRSGWSRSW
jgi:PAS domain S-box-containing protein